MELNYTLHIFLPWDLRRKVLSKLVSPLVAKVYLYDVTTNSDPRIILWAKQLAYTYPLWYCDWIPVCLLL